jgi:hypothetical protein
MNTVREVLEDRFLDILADYFGVDSEDSITQNAVVELADEAFSVCGISEDEQNEEFGE